MLDHGDAVAVLERRARRVCPVHFDPRDGMREPETNGRFQPRVAVDDRGRVVYPTQHGLAILDPRRVPALEPPAVTVTALTVDGRPLAPPAGGAAPLRLPAQAQVIELRRSAPAFTHGEDLRFRTRLVGRDEAWSAPSPQRAAAWTGLDAGRYAVELQAGWAGRWGPSVELLAVDKEPALFQRWWFFGLLVAGLALAALSLSWFGLWRAERRRRELEAAIRERTDQLALRTAELADRNARLEQLDDLRTRFVTHISHELRTPLSLVTAPLDELAGAGLDGAHRRSLDLARRSGKRLSSLVEQRMDVARMEQQGIPLRARRLDLAAFIRRGVERFEAVAAAQRIDLSVATPTRSIAVWFDPDLIDKVLTNLVGNALKFTPDGGHVRVSLAGPTAGDEHVQVRVCDTGPGIPAELRERVFERFFQADDSATRRHGGAGVGLSLSRELVELHGGAMGIRDEPSPFDSLEEVDPSAAGACFWFELPLSASHVDLDEITLTGDDARTGLDVALVDCEADPCELPDEGREHLPAVLVVEDHPDMRAYLCEQLAPAFRVRAAENGRAALAALAERRPDVVVSDIMMPEIDGLELCRRMRGDPALADLPVLLLSAKATEADRVAGLEVADDYLTKPFRPRELIARVRKLAGRGTNGDGASGGTAAPAVDALDADALGADDHKFLERLAAAVAERLADRELRTEDLARACAVSTRQLHRKVGELCDTTPSAYLREARLARAQQLMRDGRVTTVKEAAAAVGMARAYLSRVYTSWAGHPPSKELSDG